MKEYCTDCLNTFPAEELRDCICDNFLSGRKRTITTKSGIKEIDDNLLHCKDCLAMKHRHEGEVFI